MKVVTTLLLALATAACGVENKAEKEVSLNDDVAARFRTTWSGKDLAIAPRAGEPLLYCIRFTTLPGSCQYARRGYGQGDAAYRGVFADNCDVKIEDSAINVAITCTSPVELGCRPPVPDATPTIDQTNSKETLTGEELQITGLGDQDWRIGTALCDAAFATAKT